MAKNTDKLKAQAERVIRGTIQDIRMVDVLGYVGTKVEDYQAVLDLIENARVEIRWGK